MGRLPHARIHVYVSGQVQGVGFRSYIVRRAQSLGLVGWVRNLSDGRVEILAEGDGNRVEELLGFCRRGPPFSNVTHVEVLQEEPRSEFVRFSLDR